MSQSEEAKKLIQSERRRLQRMASSTAIQRMNQAREQLRAAGQRKLDTAQGTNDEALYKGLRNLIQTVGTSWGISVPIALSSTGGTEIKAATDFNSISIDYPTHMIPTKEIGGFDIDKLKSFVADVKGIAYHEIGHCRVTIPFVTLWEMVEGGSSAPDPSYHGVWNVLEDQRMENAVVNDSPIIADYFTTMVLQHLLDEKKFARMGDRTFAAQWLLIVGRRYLPSSIRSQFRKMFITEYGLDVHAELDTIVSGYMTAKTPEEMLRHVCLFKEFCDRIFGGSPNTTLDKHGGGYQQRIGSYSGEQAKKMAQKYKKMAADSAAKDLKPDLPDASDEEEGSGSGEGDEGGDEKSDGPVRGQGDPIDEFDPFAKQLGSSQKSDQDGDSEDGEGDGEGDPSSGDPSDSTKEGQGKEGEGDPSKAPSGGFGRHVGPKQVRDNMQKIVEGLKERLTNDHAVIDTIREIHQNAYKKTSSLPTYRNVGSQPMEWQVEAEKTTTEIVKALECYTAEDAPIWQSHQTRGVIDPFAYRTKIGGSMEYRRQYSDHGGQSIDLAVSVLLDVSGSMSGSDCHLGAAAYACKKACEALEIPCTVTTFEDGGYVLWGPEDHAEHLAVAAGGGTNPVECCEVLDEQQGDKTNHLVLVMTDGQFNTNFPGFQNYGNQGRYFIGFVYGGSYYTEYLQRQHAHEVYAISDLMDIPKALSGFVAAFLR